MQMLPAKLSDRARQDLPKIYTNGKKTIAGMVSLEAVTEYQAQAFAMEEYAKKIRDGQYFATAFRLRVWAMRRAGEILSKVKPAKGGGAGGGTADKGRKGLAKSVGISHHQLAALLRFAAVPLKLFTELVEDESLPTIDGLERLGKNYMVKTKQKAKGTALEEGHEDEVIVKRYHVIYADPPWRYEHPAMGSGDRSIENHYPTLDLSEICSLKVGTNKLPVSELAHEDAVLYLWTTVPKLPEALEVVTAWGFAYRTQAVWDKVHIGMGYYFRNQHEILLVAKRGNLPTPDPKNRASSVYREQRTKHSAKPIYYYKALEKMYPDKDTAKIELFSRVQRKGWDVWGFEAVKEAAE